MARLLVVPMLFLMVSVTGPSPAAAMPVHQAQARATQGTTYKHTQDVVRAFLHAYNTHDLQAVLGLLVPNAFYGECDLVRQQANAARGRSELRTLFRNDFLDNQRFLHAAVFTGNPHAHYVAGVQFLQTSRSMQRHGIPPHAEGFKVVLENPGFNRIDHMVGEGPDMCKR